MDRSVTFVMRVASAVAEAEAEERQPLVARAERRPRGSRRARRAQRQNASINSDTRGEIGQFYIVAIGKNLFYSLFLSSLC